MFRYIMVFITAPDYGQAEKISNIIVENKVGACVNIIEDVHSTFFWNGKIENQKECLLIVKSRADKFDKLKEIVSSSHPYTVPEIIAVPVVLGNDGYLKWIDETVEG